MKKHPESQGTLERISFIASAVSYRIPLPVTKVIERDNGKKHFPVCPRCSSSLEREYVAFCDRCGQRLSWNVLQWTDVVDRDDEEVRVTTK